MMKPAMKMMMVLAMMLPMVVWATPSIEANGRDLELNADRNVMVGDCNIGDLCDVKADVTDTQRMSNMFTLMSNLVSTLSESQSTLRTDLSTSVSTLTSTANTKADVSALNSVQQEASSGISTLTSSAAEFTADIQNLQSIQTSVLSALDDIRASTSFVGQLGSLPDPRQVAAVAQQNFSADVPRNGLRLWLDASSLAATSTDGAEISTWPDLSGNNVVVNSSGLRDPSFGNVNPTFRSSLSEMAGQAAVAFPEAYTGLRIHGLTNMGNNTARTLIISIHHDYTGVHNNSIPLSDAGAEFFGRDTGHSMSFATWCPNSVDGYSNTRAGFENFRMRDIEHIGYDRPNYGSVFTPNGVSFYRVPIVITVIADNDGTEIFINGKPHWTNIVCTARGDSEAGSPDISHKSPIQFFHYALDQALYIGTTNFGGGTRGFIGDIGDVLLYDRALNRTERYLAERPLLAKYLRAADYV